MNAKDDFTDSIDDIIHLLNTTNGLANKLKPNQTTDENTAIIQQQKKPIVNDSISELQKISDQRKGKFHFQPSKIYHAPPGQMNYQKRSSSRGVENKKLNSTITETQSTIPAIRYLTFKPYSGIVIENIQDNGYYFQFGNGVIKLIKCFFEENGFKETQDKNWTVLWSSSTIKNEVYLNLFAYQKVCHFPKSYEITRKDLMFRNISKMQSEYGLVNFNFVPTTFILPAEMSYFLEEHDKHKSNNYIYIIKPYASSQGRGIFISDKIQEILNKMQLNTSYVIQHYIQNPLLINNLKFDLRIYVVVTSINPLRIYIYEDGLTRFATSEYNSDVNKNNRFIHLTNYAVNKESPNFVANDDAINDNTGSKWSLVSLREYLRLNGINDNPIFERIDDLIIKSILSGEPQMFQACDANVPYRSNCFSLFGFDVLIDSNLKPWLLEINLSPSLNIDSPLDLKIKGEMIADLFTLIGIVPLDQRFSNDVSYIKNQNSFAQDKNKTFSYNNGQQQLTSFERYIIREAEEEQKRSRKFRKVFPCENSFRYKNYFQTERPLNLVLRNYYSGGLSRVQQQNNGLNSSFSKKVNNTFINAGKQKLYR